MAKQNERQRHALDAKVMGCDCKHPYQDQKHGAGMRVHNPDKDGYTCTVCGRKKPK